MYGFAKNNQANINYQEEIVYKKLVSYYLAASEGK
jgi:hypothetical protein